MNFSIENLYFKDENKLYLNNINLSVTTNEIVSVVSSSNESLNALMGSILGKYNISCGIIKYEEKELSNLPSYKRNIALVSKTVYLRDNLTVYDNIALPLRQTKMKEDLVEKIVDDTIDKLKLDVIKGVVPESISSYQKMLVSLARAISLRPDVIIFDDPLSNLKDDRFNDYYDFLKLAKNYLPKTVFMYFGRVLDVSNKVIYLSENGMITESAKISIVRDFPHTEEAYKFFNKDGNNYDKDINPKYITIPVKCYANSVEYMGEETFINQIENMRFINKNEIKYIKLDSDLFTLKDNGSYLRFEVTNVNSISNDVEELIFGEYKIIRSKGFFTQKDKYLYYPRNKVIYLDENYKRVNSFFDYQSNKVQISIINQSTGLISFGSTTYDLKRFISKETKGMVIKNSKPLKLTNDKNNSIEVIGIKHFEEFDDFNLAHLVVKCSNEPIILRIDKNEDILNKNRFFLHLDESNLS